MTNKAYIVANEQQEREVLEKLEREGCVWHSDSTKPTEYIPSKHFIICEKFPTAIVKVFNNRIMYETNYEDGNIKQDEEIVYDGRKGNKMKISKEVYDALVEWKENKVINQGFGIFVSRYAIDDLPKVIDKWWANNYINDKENNNRLIAIIRWVNGEDVFEVDKPKKWVVRSKGTDFNNHYHYAILAHAADLAETYYFTYTADGATKFDTREEAESWANAHQEIIEVEG